MANEEQLAILRQGVEAWNVWRHDHPQAEIDLREADLRGVLLVGANLRHCHLSRSNLSEANLSQAGLAQADLRECNLSQAVLTQADLSQSLLNEAGLRNAFLFHANLRDATLDNADFLGANLIDANLQGAKLMGTKLQNAELAGSKWPTARLGYTVFASSDLSRALGLKETLHRAPSSVSTDTLVLSKGIISETFLRGCGLSDWEIETVKLYNPELSNEERNKILYRIYDLQASQAIQVSPLFISYSHADRAFVDKTGDQLRRKGIRYWRDIHDLKAGRIETQIDQGIRQNPTVLLILSEHSLSSDWVEHEVRTARGLEKEMGRDVLCPVALDDSWKSSRWPKRIMEQIMEYNILDFSEWEENAKFEEMFRRLIDGLELFYKG